MGAASQAGRGNHVLLWPLEGKQQFLTVHTDGSQDTMSLCAGGLCPPSPQHPPVTTRVSQGGGAFQGRAHSPGSTWEPLPLPLRSPRAQEGPSPRSPPASLKTRTPVSMMTSLGNGQCFCWQGVG